MTKLVSARNLEREFDSVFNCMLSNMFHPHPSGTGTTFQPRPTYPKYDISHKDNTVTLEFAVAGFKADELSVTVTDRVLTVAAEPATQPTDSDRRYLCKSIARRAFKETFSLNPAQTLKTASLENGILTIIVEGVKQDPQSVPIVEVK